MDKIIEIEKLTGRDNYHRWTFAVEHAMKLQGFWKSVLGTETNEDKKEKATSRLVLYISSNLYVHIQGITTAQDIWDKLKTMYDDSGLTRRCGLLRKLTTTQLLNCGGISEYVDTIIDTAQKLNQIGLNVDDEWVGSLLLSGLPDHFAPMIMAIESSNIKITADSIKTKLLQDFDTYNNYGTNSSTTESALHTRFKGRKVAADKGRKIVCYNCKKEGHIAKFCKKKSCNAEKTLAAGLAVNFNSSENIWLVDSGATSHMTNRRDAFISFKPLDEENVVVVANNNTLKVKGVGDINVEQVLDGKTEDVSITNVLYVPNICANLLSVSQLVAKGFTIKFDDSECTIRKNAQIFMKAHLNRGMFELNILSKSKNMVNLSKEIWHKRLGHAADVNIEKLSRDETSGVDIEETSKSQICTSCLEGKMTRIPYKSSASKAMAILELVHTDVCGPMEQKSMSGSVYYVLFLDDYSSKVFVYTMKK